MESATTPGERQRDDLVQATGGRFDGQALDQALVDVRMGGRIALQQILGVADDIDAGGCARQRERQIEGDRCAGAHVDVAFERLESLRLDDDVIRIRRQIAEDVPAGGIGGRRARKAGDRVTEANLDRLHEAAGRVLDGALYGTATQPLRASRRGEQAAAHCLCAHRKEKETEVTSKDAREVRWRELHNPGIVRRGHLNRQAVSNGRSHTPMSGL